VHSDAQKQTIYALSTPPGKGGIAVIRVSGPEALEVWKRMVRPHKSRLQPTPWKLERCQIVHPENPNEVVDDGMSVFFQGELSLQIIVSEFIEMSSAPRSFTTEPTLELHTHSGKALLAALLNALSRLPFLRPAEPGEFTRRAFLSGRLDLTQVEGLADLIDAETEEQRKIAGRGAWVSETVYTVSISNESNTQGQVREVLDDLRVRVIKCLALVEALIDFGEGEDLEEGVYSQGGIYPYGKFSPYPGVLQREKRSRICSLKFRTIWPITVEERLFALASISQFMGRRMQVKAAY